MPRVARIGRDARLKAKPRVGGGAGEGWAWWLPVKKVEALSITAMLG